MANKHTEAILLTQAFLVHVRGFKENSEGIIESNSGYKAAVLENAYRCLYSGYDYDELLTLLSQHTGTYYHIEKLIQETSNASFKTSEPPREPDELIRLGQFYCHPVLQASRPAPTYVLDETTMEMTLQEPEPFFLEIKEHFTVRDVLMYYYIMHKKDPVPGGGPLTQIKNVLSAFSLDLVLYMIEASAEEIAEQEGSGAKSPAFLPDYLERAQEMLDKRRLTLREGGMTRVIPRHTYARL